MINSIFNSLEYAIEKSLFLWIKDFDYVEAKRFDEEEHDEQEWEELKPVH